MSSEHLFGGPFAAGRADGEEASARRTGDEPLVVDPSAVALRWTKSFDSPLSSIATHNGRLYLRTPTERMALDPSPTAAAT